MSFVPLIFQGGARHPWQLSAIATAIATWLGALSRSHGTRAHHKGGANSGEVQKTAQGERKKCTRTWKTNAPRVHRVVHRAHRAYVSLNVRNHVNEKIDTVPAVHQEPGITTILGLGQTISPGTTPGLSKKKKSLLRQAVTETKPNTRVGSKTLVRIEIFTDVSSQRSSKVLHVQQIVHDASQRQMAGLMKSADSEFFTTKKKKKKKKDP